MPCTALESAPPSALLEVDIISCSGQVEVSQALGDLAASQSGAWRLDATTVRLAHVSSSAERASDFSNQSFVSPVLAADQRKTINGLSAHRAASFLRLQSDSGGARALFT